MYSLEIVADWGTCYLRGLLVDLVRLLFDVRLLVLFEDLLADTMWSRLLLKMPSSLEWVLFFKSLTGLSLLEDLFF